MSESNKDSAFPELITSEHEELVRAVREAGDELASPNRERNRVNDKLIHLSEFVESHFRQEEQGGYMADALRHSPQLRARAEALKEQHEQLQEEIDKLQLLVHSGVESPHWWERVQVDFQHFAARLTNHEHAENQLVQEAFNRDIGGGD